MPYALKKVGFIAGTHGYKGHLRLKVEPGSLDNKEYLFILIEEKGVPFFIEEISNSDIVQLKFIETLEKAKAFIGMKVSVESEDIEINNEYNLIGFKVEILGSQREGIVRSIDTYPQGNMINCVINGKEILIPEVEEWITAIDLDLKVISLELPEGLLEL
jgi:16S rRNA processing protein RimM